MTIRPSMTSLVASMGGQQAGLRAVSEPSPEPAPSDPTRLDRLELSARVSTQKTEAEQPLASPPEAAPETTPQADPVAARRIPKLPVVVAQEAALERALAGEAVPFESISGIPVDVKISRGKPREGAETLALTVAGRTFTATVMPGLDRQVVLAKVIDYFANVPEHLRPALKEIELSNAPNPEDAHWAKVYGKDDFVSGATAGGGKIVFWNLIKHPDNLNESTFHHEMGHLIGDATSSSRKPYAEMIPPGWEEAAKADGNKVSDYAGQNPNEDFAETWDAYLRARKFPDTLAEFRNTYPNRCKILDALYDRTFQGAFRVGGLWPGRPFRPDGEGVALA